MDHWENAQAGTPVPRVCHGSATGLPRVCHGPATSSAAASDDQLRGNPKLEYRNPKQARNHKQEPRNNDQTNLKFQIPNTKYQGQARKIPLQFSLWERERLAGSRWRSAVGAAPRFPPRFVVRSHDFEKGGVGVARVMTKLRPDTKHEARISKHETNHNLEISK